MYKAAIVLALVAVASAGAPLAYLDHHVGAQSEQTVRGFGGLSSVSHQARTVNSAFSTSSAYKSKATNNAVAYAAPAVAAYHAPAAVQYASPVQYAHAVAPAPVAYAAAAPVLRAAPVAKAVAAHPAGLLGVAYSPVVPGVATLTFDGFGVHYGY